MLPQPKNRSRAYALCDPVWQVTLRSSAMDLSTTSVTFFNGRCNKCPDQFMPLFRSDGIRKNVSVEAD